MPNENLIVACPKCGMQFEIPPEYLGQTAECSGCHFTFVLSLPSEKQPSAPVKNDITTACTKCGSRFEVAAGFLGETAECPDCGSLFVIAAVDHKRKETPPAQSAPPAQPVPPPEGTRKADVNELTVTEAEKDLATNTIKISKKAIGMKPDFKDHFYNNFPPPPPEPEPPARKKPSPPPLPPSPPPAAPTKKQKPAKKWWKFWTWFR